MPSDRQRQWRNEVNLLTPAAASQVSVQLATGLFNKGCTPVRLLLSVSIPPVTLTIPARVHFGVWSGVPAGIPTPLVASGDDGFLLWDEMVLRVGLLGEGGFFVTKSYDLRAQRKSRQDADALTFSVQTDGASAANVYVVSRVLCLLP